MPTLMSDDWIAGESAGGVQGRGFCGMMEETSPFAMWKKESILGWKGRLGDFLVSVICVYSSWFQVLVSWFDRERHVHCWPIGAVPQSSLEKTKYY